MTARLILLFMLACYMIGTILAAKRHYGVVSLGTLFATRERTYVDILRDAWRSRGRSLLVNLDDLFLALVPATLAAVVVFGVIVVLYFAIARRMGI
jgi:hypothetical protein